MKRLNWIDVSKGICILAVIIGHMGNNTINKIVFPFHLTVFFIISGYTLKEDKLNREYLGNKFKRLMLPYFVTCLFILLMDIINLIVIKHNYTIYSISSVLKKDLLRTFFASGGISTFGTINLNGRIGAIWFLPALYFALVMSKIILQKNETYFTRFSVSGIIAIIGMISSKFIWLPFSIQSSMLACPFLIFGKWMQEKNLPAKIKGKEGVILLSIYILGCILNKSMILFVSASMPDFIISPIIGLSASILVIKLSQFLEGSKFLRYVGKNSLYFLCVHLFLLETSGFYISKIYTMLHIEYKFYITFMIHVVICFFVTQMIHLLKRLFNHPKKILNNTGRDLTIDVLRAICIIA